MSELDLGSTSTPAAAAAPTTTPFPVGCLAGIASMASISPGSSGISTGNRSAAL